MSNPVTKEKPIKKVKIEVKRIPRKQSIEPTDYLAKKEIEFTNIVQSSLKNVDQIIQEIKYIAKSQ